MAFAKAASASILPSVKLAMLKTVPPAGGNVCAPLSPINEDADAAKPSLIAVLRVGGVMPNSDLALPRFPRIRSPGKDEQRPNDVMTTVRHLLPHPLIAIN